MSSRPDIKLAWCDAKAARFACEKWHYSGTMPSAGVKIGVWEDGLFVGAVLYGVGAGNITRGERYGLSRSHEIAELMRVALSPNHVTPTSRIVAISMKMVARQSPGLKMLISFADEMEQGHIGTIYQASNWTYLGAFDGDGSFMIRGKKWHNKSVHSAGWKQQVQWLREHVDPNTTKARTLKHRYGYGLTPDVRNRLAALAEPYPKAPEALSEDAPAHHAGEGGAEPTPALNINETHTRAR